MSTEENTASAFSLGSEELTEKLNRTGYRSVFDIYSESLPEFEENNPDIPKAEAKAIYRQAVQRTENLVMLSKAWQLHNDPVIRNNLKLSSSTGLESLNLALEKSLGGGSDFNDLFPERSPEGYADAASIQSLFSPGRYLTALYKIARQLHVATGEPHIDKCRPDLQTLILSDHNMNQEVSSLDILLGVLQPDGTGTLSSLKDTYYPMKLPYDDDLTQIRAAVASRSTSLLRIWDTLLDNQRSAIFQDAISISRICMQRSLISRFNKADISEFLLGQEFYLETNGERIYLQDSPSYYYLHIGQPVGTNELIKFRLLSYIHNGNLYFSNANPEDTINGEKLNYLNLRNHTLPGTNKGPYGIMTNFNNPEPVINLDYNLPVQIERITDTSIRIFVPGYGYIGPGPYINTYQANPMYLNVSLSEALIFTLRKNATGNETVSIYDIMPNKIDTTPSPVTREILSLTPGSYQLLVNQEPTATEIADHYNVKGTTPGTLTIALNFLDSFLEKTGLSFNRLLELTAQEDYQTKSKEYQSRFIKFGKKGNVPVMEYGAVYLTEEEDTPLWVKQYSSTGTATNTPVLNFTENNVVVLAGRTEKLVRLSESTGLSFEHLDWLITNASKAVVEHLGKIIMAKPVLDTLADYVKLHERYGISVDEFVTFIGEVNTYALKDEKSLYQLLFSTADGDTIPLGKVLQVAVDMQGLYESVCLGAMGVTSDEFLRICGYCFGVKVGQVTVNEGNMARLYRMGRIPRMLGLSFTEAEQLWKIMAGGEGGLLLTMGSLTYSMEPLKIIRRTEILLAWMDSHGLDIITLQGMVTKDYGSTATPELYNFLSKVYQAAVDVTLATRYEESLPEEKLYRALAAGFDSKPNVMSKVVTWMDGTGTEFSFNDFWEKLREYFEAGHEDALDALEKETGLLQWCQRLSQYVLIVKWCGLSEQDLELLTEHPDWLMDGQTDVPSPSLRLLLVLTRLKEWQQRVVVTSDEAMRYYAQANAEGMTAEEGLKLLAKIQGWNEEYTVSVSNNLLGDNEYPRNFEQAYTLESWVSLGSGLNVGSKTLGDMAGMSEETEAAESSQLISSVAENMMAGALALGQDTALLRTVKEARRDVLVSNYIARYVSREFTDKITDADSLYEYLLLDTKISDLVTTSPVAEAISSIQLYINCYVEGYEGALSTQSSGLFAEGKFLYNWDAYNRRYSTWAGKERLKYYAGSYIDPTLRNNKTELFKTFENSISQGRITEESIKTALQSYLTGYEVLADLTYISANKGADESILFFVGRTKEVPYEYYWRQLTLKADSSKLVADRWGEWKKITASTSEADDDYVVPYWGNNRLHVKWVTMEKEQVDGGSTEDVTYVNDWVLNSSGTWHSFSRNYYDYSDYTYFKLVSLGSKDHSFDYNNIWLSGNRLIYNDPNFRATLTILTPTKMRISVKKTLKEDTNIDSYSYLFSNFYYNDINELDDFLNSKDFNDSCVAYELDSVGEIEVTIIPGEKYWLSGLSLKNYRYDVYAFCFTPVITDFLSPIAYGSIKDGQYTPPSGNSNIKGPLNLILKNNIDLSHLLDTGLNTLFSYDIQGVGQLGGTAAFSGPYGIYLWEVFFHIPFLSAVRFGTEERYALAGQWFKYIFNSTGYRDENGKLLTNNGNTRYWNVVPLQEDSEWDDTLSMATVDPDEIAMSDPMQYKLGVFLHYLTFLLSRGDSAYRKLERDTMTEAKMYYIQAGQLLGARPEIRINDSWPDPTLQSEAVAMTSEPTRGSTDTTPAAGLRTVLRAENGHFLPPYNDDLLAYWDKIDLRLYNLRHNLSLDGQPLSLPLYAEPASPSEILAKYSTGDGLEGSISSTQGTLSPYRFPLVAGEARTAVSSVIQFGVSFESALEKQDAEAMTLLLQSQQQSVLQQARDIQERNLEALQASLEATRKAKEGAESDKVYYSGLSENWISENETRALNLHTNASIVNGSSAIPAALTGVLDSVPNIFGLATGGGRWGAVSDAVMQDLQISSQVIDQSANIMEISESYRRRREEWMKLRDDAENDITQLEPQISSLEEQIQMAKKQLSLSEREYANIQAVYELQNTRFTGQALYNWLAGRLSSLYYQMYDMALSQCLMAKNALEKELGDGKAAGIFKQPAWNDLYQGLLAGEMLMLELQKLDDVWLKENSRGMEAVKTVSLNTLIRKADPELTFASLLEKVLNGSKTEALGGVDLKLEDGIFSGVLDLSVLGLGSSYNQTEKARRIKNLSVTLPTLLGPYQDIEATLTLGGETIALSHGMDDSGLFVADFNDSRFLPFEGENPTRGSLILAIFHTEENGEQRNILENLNDIIFHIRYIIK